MASTAISLHLRPNRHRLIQNPNFIYYFSSSSSSSSDDNSSPPPPPSPSPSPPPPQSSFTSYFNDVKASLKQSPPPKQQQQPNRSFSPSFNNASSSSSSKGVSLEELRKNLSEFRRRTTPPPPNMSERQPVSFHELYKRNVSGKDEPGKPGGLTSMEAIKQNLKQITQDQGEGSKTTIDRLKETLKWGPNASSGGSSIKFPSFIANESGDKKPMSDMNMKFVKTYNYVDMGTKLKQLRPEVEGKNWFSLTELKERLTKLRQIEAKEANSRMDGVFKEIKHSLYTLHTTDNDKPKKNTIHKLDILGQLGGTPEFMLSPPQEHLVEKYFHPDNMSSGEKLKIELKKVRDEFKMSESDCGSARVVVAQLTTKIKHLSSVLHKKDKHSRKGLQAMVQQRKKLLKYLRRTDWDSYCFVLSRLGLRDNPDYKF